MTQVRWHQVRPKHPLEDIIKNVAYLPSEKDIQRAILEYLKYKGYFCWRNNTGGFRDKRDHFYQFGKVGSGDILGLTREGRFFSIEVKAKANKPSPKQEEFIEAVKASGGIAFVAYSVDDVIQQL